MVCPNSEKTCLFGFFISSTCTLLAIYVFMVHIPLDRMYSLISLVLRCLQCLTPRLIQRPLLKCVWKERSELSGCGVHLIAKAIIKQ